MPVPNTKRLLACFVIIAMFVTACVSGSHHIGIVDRGGKEIENPQPVKEALYNASLNGRVSVSYVDNVPSGGMVYFGSTGGLIDTTGGFLIPFLRPANDSLVVVFEGAPIVIKQINIEPGINNIGISIDTIVPSLMVKHVLPGMSDDELFRPVNPMVYSHGNVLEKRVSITLDDGFSRDEKLLSLFEEYNIACTVFIIGGRGIGEKRPDWIRRMDEHGFEVCTHTFDHSTLTRLTDKQIEDELRKGQKVITNVTGKKYAYIRPPMGVYDDRVLKIAARNGYKLVLWNNAIYDYVFGIKAEHQKASVLNTLKNGDIIIAHFGAYNTYAVLKEVIPEILKRGYEIVTISRLLEGMQEK
jgi:peptidoglycan/xylan/chitin deacetylase (PgdA/CDA1 family)